MREEGGDRKSTCDRYIPSANSSLGTFWAIIAL